MSAVLDESRMLTVQPYHTRFRAQSMELARAMVRDSAYGDMPFDGEKVMNQIEGPYSAGKDYYLRIVARGDELYGGFLGMVFRSLFCDQLIAKDIGWWVSKSHRGSQAAILLLRDFEAWAADKKAVKIIVGQASGVDVARTTKLYQHCGYSVVGYNTMKNIK